ncbi:MAG TPA: hypothetical protein VHR43_01250 [Gemmatimonadales bacterium]|nr:hypothetical protein [Gemmatimonadales bacterium]
MPRPALLTTALALLVTLPLAGQQSPVPQPPVPTASLVGQPVAVVPMTLVAIDPAIGSDTLFRALGDRRATLSWADSLIGDALVGRAPEVKWVLPPRLRKVARRAPGLVDDPDAMGQAMLRSPRLKEVPDPLRASLRNLMAVVGGRVAFVPAAVGFTRDTTGIRAELSLVAADTRSGRILWRSVPVGTGPTPAAALGAALAAVLPLDQ